MKLTPVLVALALAAGVGSAHADRLRVGVGATYSLGSGKTQLNCGTLTVEGTLRGQSALATGLGDVQIQGGLLAGDAATFVLSGDWNNQGTFHAGTSTVRMNTSCTSTLRVLGSNDFCVLEVDAPNGGTLTFPGGLTRVNCQLTLRGGTAPLRVVSLGAAAQVCAPKDGTQLTNVTFEGADVSVSDCVPGVPVAGPWVLAVLALMLAGVGGGALRRRTR